MGSFLPTVYKIGVYSSFRDDLRYVFEIFTNVFHVDEFVCANITERDGLIADHIRVVRQITVSNDAFCG